MLSGGVLWVPRDGCEKSESEHVVAAGDERCCVYPLSRERLCDWFRVRWRGAREYARRYVVGARSPEGAVAEWSLGIYWLSVNSGGGKVVWFSFFFFFPL